MSTIPRRSIIRVQTGERIYLEDFSFLGIQQAQYVSDWFNKEDATKPPLHVPVIYKTLPAVKSALYFAMKSGKLTSELVVEYAYLLFDTKKDILAENWESFKVKIGARGEAVGPLDLVRVTKHEQTAPAEVNAQDQVTVPDYELLLMCLIPYRFKGCHENRSDTLMTKLKRLTPNVPDVVRRIIATSNNGALLADQRYKAVVAITDMYFNMFPNSDGAFVRFATVGSRYKDCAALLSVNHAMEFLGFTEKAQLLDWIFTTTVEKEMKQMMHPGQEEDQPYSYFPYQADFGLVRKSYYSTVLNPATFFFLHVWCALLGSERSLHARMPNNDFYVANILANAKIAAYALKSRVNEAVVESLERESTSQADVDESPEPSSTSGSVWFKYMSKRNFEPTQRMQAFLRSRVNGFSNVRAGSIGAYIKKNLI